MTDHLSIWPVQSAPIPDAGPETGWRRAGKDRDGEQGWPGQTHDADHMFMGGRPFDTCPNMHEVHTDAYPSLNDLPISQAIVHGDTVYVAGTVPRDPETNELVDGDMTAQAEQVMKNLAGILQAAGSSIDRVVKATVFLEDVDDRAAFNEVYARYIDEPYPARSAVGVDLAVDAGVEVEVIAALE